MIRYGIDPFNIIVKVCNELYPKLNVDIFFVPTEVIVEILKDNDSNEETAHGIALHSDDGNHVVYINSEMPASECMPIIANEITNLMVDDNDKNCETLREKIVHGIQEAYENEYDKQVVRMEEGLMVRVWE